jgi:hypothetical protein
MPHNIPLIRSVYEQITQHPETHYQASWFECIAGWAIRLHNRDWAILTHAQGIQTINLRTGEIRWTDAVAAELLGFEPEEAAGIFGASDRMARDWLEDIIVAYEMRELDLLASGFDPDEYPVSEVRG